MRTPLPSNTHGPASLRGVIGPSCPFIIIRAAGFADVGDGVLVSLRPPVAACAPLAVRVVGIGIGLDVALAESWPLVESLGLSLALLPLFVEEAPDCRMLAGVSELASVMVTSIASESCCAGVRTGSAGVGGATGIRTLRTLLADSLDFRGGAMVCDWGAAAAVPLGFGAAAPSCSSFSSSESACSHSSGSSTSASRSAAARQLGQMKIGYDGDDSRERMHL